MEDYILILNEPDYAELLSCFEAEPGFTHLIKSHSTEPNRGLIKIKMSKPEMCLILDYIERYTPCRMGVIVRTQFILQDDNFYKYYDGLKRDMLKFYGM